MFILNRTINLLHKYEKLDMEPDFKLLYQAHVDPQKVMESILHMALVSYITNSRLFLTS